MTQMNPIRISLQLEGAAVAVLAVWGYAQSDAGWGIFALLILAPDLAMLGYLAGNRVGAICYNFAHSYLAPVGLLIAGHVLGLDWTWPLALIWTTHIGMDRAIGYGLKYAHSFKATHLQRI